MKLWLKGLIAVWLIVSSVLLSRWLYRNPDSFPSFFDSAWDAIYKLIDPVGQEFASSLEGLFTLGVSFILVSIITFFLIWVWYILQKQLR